MLKITDQSRKWWILVAMGACGGLIMLDETVVGVALPTVRRDLGMSRVAAHWVISVYMLVFAGAAAAGGRLDDVVGFRNLLAAGAAVFGLASLASGFADNGAFLITARLLGGTIGMSVCSTLLVMTGSFQVVFLATAMIMFVALLFGWFAIEYPHRARLRPIPRHHGSHVPL